MMEVVNILGVQIAAVDLQQAASQIEEWIRNDERRYVTVTGVHGIMESQKDPALMEIHRQAGMCVPDGMPTVVVGRLYGHKRMRRVYGPDLMLEMLRRSVAKGHRHFFYGGKECVADILRERMVQRFPGLKVVGTYTPPFRPLTEAQEAELGALLESLAPDIIWVGLSTPKQERWMADHVGKLNARVLIGVGAAFDFHAGILRQSPRWMQVTCLEWLFRLIMEPRRLWRRYLYNNPRFIIGMLAQVAGLRGRK